MDKWPEKQDEGRACGKVSGSGRKTVNLTQEIASSPPALAPLLLAMTGFSCHFGSPRNETRLLKKNRRAVYDEGKDQPMVSIMSLITAINADGYTPSHNSSPISADSAKIPKKGILLRTAGPGRGWNIIATSRM